MARDLLDLHGKTVEEIWSLVDRFIRQAQDAGLSQVRIMTGKGSGKVREETLRALRFGKFPHRPEPLKHGKVNDGVWIVSI